MITHSNKCILILHDRSIENYQESDGQFSEYKLTEKLFNNFKTKRKEKHPLKTTTVDISEIKMSTENLRIEEFLTDCKIKNLFNTLTNSSDIDEIKQQNIKFMNEFHSISNNFNEFHGQNDHGYGHITKLNNQEYLIPPTCRFFNKPVDKISEFLNDSEKFDFIVIDPPFRCRYIKRLKRTCHSKSYQMMDNQDVLNIPIQNHTHKKSIVVIWCTNSDGHEEFVRTDVMKTWNLKLVAAWKWVKIDGNGDTFCPLSDAVDGKKPYEKIFVATHEDNDEDVELKKDLMIFSQPSSVHSHKPPLRGEFFYQRF